MTILLFRVFLSFFLSFFLLFPDTETVTDTQVIGTRIHRSNRLLKDMCTIFLLLSPSLSLSLSLCFFVYEFTSIDGD